MIVMKKFVWVSILCWSALVVGAADATWLTDRPKAQAQARTEGKIVLVDFTGSDWCGWCIKLQKEVFSKPEFQLWARANAVLVEIDFPRGKKQSAEVKTANEALARNYGIKGFPTIVLLSSEGKRLGTVGYTPGGPAAFITEVRKVAPKSGQAAQAPSDLTAQARPRPAAVPEAGEPAADRSRQSEQSQTQVPADFATEHATPRRRPWSRPPPPTQTPML